MSEQSNPPVVDPVTPVGGNEEPKKETVSYDTHRKLLDEKKKVQQERDALAAEKKQREEEEAKKRGDYETLLKTREEELNNYKTKYNSLQNNIVEAQKLTAVLGAAGSPIEQKWHGLIDTSKIAVHPESGEIDQMSVTKVVEDLRKSWPEMFKNPNPAKLPADAPQGNGAGKISRAEWLKLPSNKMKEYKLDQILD